MTQQNGHDKSASELVKDLSAQTSELVRKEVELAKIELMEKGRHAGIGAGLFGAAGLLGLAAVATLTACAVLALATAMEPWLAALIVAAVYGTLAGFLALAGRRKVRQAGPATPEQTVETLKEDIAWVKTQARRS